ncbi:MAG: hypothetical protein ACRDXX_03670 [Stackebrandtia sp.]
MGVIADRLDRMTVKVTSPDGHIKGKLADRDQVSVRFRPGSYVYYTEQALERQLSRLGTLLWTGYQRGYLTVVTEAGGEVLRGPQDAWDASSREFLARRRDVKVECHSPDRTIQLRTVGLSEWTTRIAPGTLDWLSEAGFLEALHAVVPVTVGRYFQKVEALKYECFEKTTVANDPQRL